MITLDRMRLTLLATALITLEVLSAMLRMDSLIPTVRND